MKANTTSKDVVIRYKVDSFGLKELNKDLKEMLLLIEKLKKKGVDIKIKQ